MPPCIIFVTRTSIGAIVQHDIFIGTLMEQRIAFATKHITEILQDAILHDAGALVIYDEDSELAQILTEGYRRALPEAKFLSITGMTKESAIAEFATMSPGDLVVMVQSKNFRLDDFRIRISLFQQHLKVIEHMHLYRMTGPEVDVYIDALHYDPHYYHPLGHGVRERLRQAQSAEVRCQDTVLRYDSPFEDPKLNIGDYREMTNIGGTFPIGEVFTEPKDLFKVNGEARIFAFAGLDFMVQIHEPFKVSIKDGILSPMEGAPQDFLDIIDLIEKDEPVYVREMGLGMNKAISKEHILSDVTSFERINGLHLSLGAKHSIYGKPGFKKKGGRYHIDVFIAAEEILLDGEVLFDGENYLV